MANVLFGGVRGVLALAGWEQSLRQCLETRGQRNSSQRLNCSSRRVAAPLETRHYSSHLDGPRACAFAPRCPCGAGEGPGTGTEKILRAPVCRAPSNNPAEGPRGSAGRGGSRGSVMTLQGDGVTWHRLKCVCGGEPGAFVIHSVPDISVEWLMAGSGADPGGIFLRKVLDNDVPASDDG